jgi:hypothetical protein
MGIVMVHMQASKGYMLMSGLNLKGQFYGNRWGPLTHTRGKLEL